MVVAAANERQAITYLKRAVKTSEVEESGPTRAEYALSLRDLTEGDRQRIRLMGHSSPIYAVAMTPDGHLAASACVGRTVRVWDLERWTVVAVYTSDLPMRDCAVSDDGRAIAALDALGRVHLLRLEPWT